MREKTDYFENDEPVQRRSFCAFIDVLGFSQRIRESYKTKEPDELLRRFHAVLRRNISRMEETAKDSMLYFNSLTDNVVIAHPAFSTDMESEFGFILWAVREFQYDMALNGFFVRGGLAVGPMFVDRHTAYGEALLVAYEIETTKAVNPIVAVCPATQKLIDQHIKYYAGEDAPQKIDVLVNQDGRYFLNYLSEAVDDSDWPYRVDIAGLQRHKTEIEHALRDQVRNSAVFSKFAWLAQYHNYFCGSIKAHIGNVSTLLIDENEYRLKLNSL